MSSGLAHLKKIKRSNNPRIKGAVYDFSKQKGRTEKFLQLQRASEVMFGLSKSEYFGSKSSCISQIVNGTKNLIAVAKFYGLQTYIKHLLLQCICL